MRFGSVCSGIEAASVAWHPLGWEAAWLSEIEPFPSAVLAHHYPNVPNLGDMTTLPERILSGEVEAPDLFCGGTPCQAFSVAGLRNSLDDARGNLSLTFVGIANAIDHVRSVRSTPPAIVFWENVPGVLSTKDNAFGCFLAALAGEDDPIIPSGEKWTNAGCVYGPQRAVAWRVLDAQYFGVAQRRRRVFVVASARDDFDPAAVLFEFDGVRRDTAPSREKGQAIAPCVTNGPTFSRTGNERVEAEAMVVQKKQWPADIAFTLDTTFGTKQGLEDQHVNAGCPLFVPAQTFSIPAIGHIVQDEVASTMTRHTGSGSGETQNPAFVAQPVATFSCAGIGAYTEDTNSATLLKSGQDLGNGCEALVAQPMAYTTKLHNTTSNQAGKVYEEYSTSLDANSPPPAVFQPINFGAQMSVPQVDFDLCQTLQAKNPMAVAQAIAIQDVRPVEKAQNGKGWNDDGTAYTVDTHATQGVAQPYIGGVDYENNAHTMDQPTGPLLKGSPTGGGRPLPAIATAMQVRRLTPVECERLQGFPDGYTNISWRKKPEAPDGPRYKALGNSWAVPVVAWIGKRIQEAINAPI